MPGMIQPSREITFWPDGTATVIVHPLFGSSGPPKPRTMKLSKEQYDAWQAGEYIQRAMPHLTSEEREFLMSGLDQEAWDELWKEED